MTVRYTTLSNIIRAQDDFKNILKNSDVLSPILIWESLVSNSRISAPSCADDDLAKSFRFYCYI